MVLLNFVDCWNGKFCVLDVYYGLIIVGGQIVLVFIDGLFWMFDLVLGQLINIIELLFGVVSEFIVVGDMLYVINKEG